MQPVEIILRYIVAAASVAVALSALRLHGVSGALPALLTAVLVLPPLDALLTRLFPESAGQQPSGQGVLRTTFALEGIRQVMMTPSYLLWRRWGALAAYGRVGLPVVFDPNPNVGGELGAGGVYFIRGGIGLVGELVGDVFYGAGTRDVFIMAVLALSGVGAGAALPATAATIANSVDERVASRPCVTGVPTSRRKRKPDESRRSSSSRGDRTSGTSAKSRTSAVAAPCVTRPPTCAVSR